MAVLVFQITCLLKNTRLKTYNYVASCRVSRAELTQLQSTFGRFASTSGYGQNRQLK